MRSKLLVSALIASLVALAAWCVDRGGSAAADPDNEAAPSAQSAEPPSAKIPAKYHETIRKGLDYLVKHQRPDGHWEGDGGKHPVAMTGLVGLALLMEKQSAHARRRFVEPAAKTIHEANIRKAADWLMAQSQPRRDGLIYSDHASETTRYMEGHGLATLFLAGVCRDETDKARRKKLTEVLTRAVKYIARAQSGQGGWYHTSRVEGHDVAAISATAIQLQALYAAENAGIAMPGGVIDGGRQYLQTAMAEYAKAGTQQKSSQPADTAAALACEPFLSSFIFAGAEREKKECYRKWLEYCRAEIPTGPNTRLRRDEIAHYYYAQALANLGVDFEFTDVWSPYRTAMFDYLQSCQNKDGSWPPGEGIGVGRVYSTALWCVVLQLDNASHPSRKEDLRTRR